MGRPKGLGYVCPVCSREFQCKSTGQRHEATHKKSTEDRKIYKCKFCSFKTPYDGTLYCHQQVKHGITGKYHLKYHQHMCTACGKRFLRLDGLKRHILTHSTAREHSCDYCSEKYKSKTGLRDHLMKVHDLKQVCNVCRKEYFTQRALLIHQRDYHDMIVHFSKCKPKIGKRCPVLSCELVHNSMSEVLPHLTNDHALKSCPVLSCELTFNSMPEVMHHLTNDHALS